MEGKPDIRLVPSVVSGDPNDRRSIITAASIPAKKLGIKTAQPVSMALRTCPTLVLVRGDWEWYKRCSEGFITICRSYSPVLQQFSIDECFIDMSLRCTPENAVAMATRLVGQKFALQLHKNANGRDDFRASTVSMFIKYKDFTVAQKQTSLSQPTDITAVILNEARLMLTEVWDGVTPIRQVGLGVSKLTHENCEQMSLFEDPKLEYYREWDRQYDEQRAQAEDARMLAYERKVAPVETPPPPTEAPPARARRQYSGASPVRRSMPKDDALVFTYDSGEKALAAAKKAIKGHPAYRFHRATLPDGTDCFEVVED